MRTIVVLEDDDESRELIGEALRVHAYQPVLTTDHFDAYQVIRREQPALVILDLIGSFDPEAGWHLLNLLRSDPLTVSIPAILYSVNVPYLRSRKFVIEAKGATVLEKPFDLPDLIRLVEHLIGG